MLLLLMLAACIAALYTSQAAGRLSKSFAPFEPTTASALSHSKPPRHTPRRDSVSSPPPGGDAACKVYLVGVDARFAASGRSQPLEAGRGCWLVAGLTPPADSGRRAGKVTKIW